MEFDLQSKPGHHFREKLPTEGIVFLLICFGSILAWEQSQIESFMLYRTGLMMPVQSPGFTPTLQEVQKASNSYGQVASENGREELHLQTPRPFWGGGDLTYRPFGRGDLNYRPIGRGDLNYRPFGRADPL